jgi:hypothetical protein
MNRDELTTSCEAAQEDNIFRIFGGDKIQGLMTVCPSSHACNVDGWLSSLWGFLSVFCVFLYSTEVHVPLMKGTVHIMQNYWLGVYPDAPLPCEAPSGFVHEGYALHSFSHVPDALAILISHSHAMRGELKRSSVREEGCMQAFRVDDLPIESGMLTDALDNAQRKVEAYFFDIRKQLWEYDQVCLQARN